MRNAIIDSAIIIKYSCTYKLDPLQAISYWPISINSDEQPVFSYIRIFKSGVMRILEQ